MGHATLATATVNGKLNAPSSDNAVSGGTVPQDLVVNSLTVNKDLMVKGASKLGTGLAAGQLALQVKTLITGGRQLGGGALWCVACFVRGWQHLQRL